MTSDDNSVRKITTFTAQESFECWIPGPLSAKWFVMASNCQLCGLDRCSGGSRAAQHPALRRATRLSTLALLLFTAACGDDAGSTDASTGDATSEASSSPTTPTTLTSSSSPTTGATDEPGTTTATTGDPGVVGPHFGLLTFTLYPADAAGAPVLLGMAGAWRTTAFTTDDFYAVHALGLHFPLAPAAADTLESHEPQVYEWGKAETWVALGNGVRLTHAGGDALACLELVADSYPVYFSDDAPIFDPSCAPDPAQWLPATAYDLVSYGGETYADQTRLAAVTTPTALVVTAPAIDEFDFPLAKTDDLAITWQADGGAGDRIVIRVLDQFGKQLVVHATDDGSYTIPGADLDMLSSGPATLTLAREHLGELGLEPGTLRVVARHEVTAYPDLF